jgi:hypothetical protein
MLLSRLTLTAQNGYPPMGYSVGHDELTMASLAPYFNQLMNDWPEGAATLAYLLTSVFFKLLGSELS